MKKQIKYTLILLAILFPAVSFAQFNGIRGLLTSFGGLLNQIIRIIFGLAMIYFFWGVSQFIINSGEQKSRDEGKRKMLWGVIALFVMFSIYGILNWMGTILGIQQSGVIDPTIFNLPI